MSKMFRRRPSAPLVISILALVLAASGSAMAASRLVSGNSLIKQHSLSGNRLQNHTLTGTQINLSKLGRVPNAAKAGSATTAGSAAISTVTYVTVDSNAPAGGIEPTTATCPAGTIVIGGGGQAADPNSGFVNDSYPNGKAGWTVDFGNFSSSPTSVTTTAICAPAAATATKGG